MGLNAGKKGEVANVVRYRRWEGSSTVNVDNQSLGERDRVLFCFGP